MFKWLKRFFGGKNNIVEYKPKELRTQEYVAPKGTDIQVINKMKKDIAKIDRNVQVLKNKRQHIKEQLKKLKK